MGPFFWLSVYPFWNQNSGMETLFTTPLNHQRFDDYHWFFAADLHETLWKLDGFHAIWHDNFICYPPESPKIWWFSLIFCCWFAWNPMKTWWFSCNLAWQLYLLPSWITKDLMIFIDFFAANLHENLWKLDGFHPIWHGNFIYYPPESSKIWWCSLIFCCWFAWKPLKTWWFSCKSAGELYLLPPWIIKDLMIIIDFLLLICMKTYENLMVFMQFCWGTLFTTLLNHQRFDDFHWFFAANLHENLWKLDGFHANQLGNFIYYPPESPKIWWCSLIFCCWFAWKPMKTWWLSCKSAGELYLPPSWITKDLMIFIDFCCWFACFQQF